MKFNLTDWTPVYMNLMPNSTLLSYSPGTYDYSPLGFLSEDETKLFLIVRISTGVGVLEADPADGSISKFHELAYSEADNRYEILTVFAAHVI